MRKAFLSTFAVALVSLSLTGCSSDDGLTRLNVHRDQSDDQYVDTFDRALFTQSKNGQVDLILLAGGNGVTDGDQSAGNSGGSPLISSDSHAISTGVKQVVHLRVLWEPTRTIHLDSPSATNAFVDWHVIADEKDRVSYTGSCWAMVKIDGDEATIDLRNANVSVSQVLGNVQDPLKRADLSGKFTATRSDATVQSYLSQLAAIDHTNATASTASRSASIVP